MKENEKVTSTSPEETGTSSTVTTLNNETARHKMIFLALLSGAMAYRTHYIDSDVEAHKTLCEEMATAAVKDSENKGGKMKRSTVIKKIEQRMVATHNDYKRKVEKFNRVCADEVEVVRNEFKIPSDKSFESYVEGFGTVIEQYLNAKSTGDFISICQAYNAGLLDETIQVIKEKAMNQLEEVLDKLDVFGDPDKSVVDV